MVAYSLSLAKRSSDSVLLYSNKAIPYSFKVASTLLSRWTLVPAAIVRVNDQGGGGIMGRLALIRNDTVQQSILRSRVCTLRNLRKRENRERNRVVVVFMHNPTVACITTIRREIIIRFIIDHDYLTTIGTMVITVRFGSHKWLALVDNNR